MYWYRPRDKFDDKLMEELENQFKNYTFDELMNALEKMTTMYSKKDESELQVNNDEHDKPEDEYDAHDQGKHDAVNRPSYYCGKIEVIDYIEDKKLDYHLGTAVKYISRAGKKHERGMTDKEKEIQDLQKAVWFINRKIELLKNED